MLIRTHRPPDSLALDLADVRLASFEAVDGPERPLDAVDDGKPPRTGPGGPGKALGRAGKPSFPHVFLQCGAGLAGLRPTALLGATANCESYKVQSAS